MNHSWEQDKNYQGSFEQKDICVHCGCVRLTGGWIRKKGINHPVRVYHYYLNNNHLEHRPNCTGPKQVFPNAFQNPPYSRSDELFQ